MISLRWHVAMWLAVLCAAPGATAQLVSKEPYIGYVYPAGGQQGTALEVTVGGQYLDGVNKVIVSGKGVKATVVGHTKPLTQKKMNELRQKLQQVERRLQAQKKKRGKGGKVDSFDKIAKDLDASPEELVRYIEKLKTTPPEATDYASFVRFRSNVAGAILKASDKILAADANDDQKSEAVGSKIIALSVLSQLGDAEAQAKLAKLPEELEKAGLSHFVREAKAVLLQSRLQGAMRASPDEFKKLVEQIKSFLSEGPLGRREVGLAMRAAQGAEMTGNVELAVAVYRDTGKLLAASDEQQIAAMGTRMVGAARRLALMGKKMHVEGVTLDGKPLDWTQYAGKVVLVDFWATWCGPCLQEIPNVIENYGRYHDRGFEVVAISIDDDRGQLETFVQERELPWTVLFDADPDTKSMADYYGVFGIPTVILVGADGKVVSLNARGPALGKALERLLGPVEDAKEDTKGDKPGEKG